MVAPVVSSFIVASSLGEIPNALDNPLYYNNILEKASVLQLYRYSNKDIYNLRNHLLIFHFHNQFYHNNN